MKRFASILLLLAAAVGSVFAQASTIAKVDLSPAEVDRIVKKFTANELAFREALSNYVFSRSANINTIGMGGQVTGTFRLDSEMIFTHDGQRVEKIVFAPMPTVSPNLVTKEDLEDLGGVTPFALEPSSIPQYNFTFVGKEKIDELNLYVFDVAPKIMPKPEKDAKRLFIGRIWVDDRDLMIVKSKGKGIPEYKDNKFPVVETWRENVDGKYWFPSYASSDDELVFDDGNTLKIRLRVKYNDYKLGRTDVRIVGEEDVVDEKPAASPSPTPKKP
jgi:hypothetical protein